MPSAPPIGFDYRGSRWLMMALSTMAVLAIAALLLSALPPVAQTAGGFLVAATGGVAIARLLRPRVASVLWHRDGTLQLQLRDTLRDARREATGQLQASHVLGPVITLKLAWRQRGRATLWLLPDNADADTRRRLRIRLRHGVQDVELS